MAQARGVLAASMQAGPILYVVGSISTKTGDPPAYRTELAVAMKDRLGHSTSSPGLTPADTNARCKAVVQEDTATAWTAPTYSAKRFSNSATRTPWLTQPLRSPSRRAFSSS